MPWKPSDADKFKTGMSFSEKKKWAAIANSVLSECRANGMEPAICDRRAIMVASGTIDKDRKKRNRRRGS